MFITNPDGTARLCGKNCCGTLTFSVNEDGQLVITGDRGESIALTLPSGFFYRSVAQDAAVTGTLNETILHTLELDVTKLDIPTTIHFHSKLTKANSGGSGVVKMYLSDSSSSIVGATQIALFNPTATQRWVPLFRDMVVKAVNSQFMFLTSGNSSNDLSANTIASSTLAVDLSTTKWLIVTAQLTSVADTITAHETHYEIQNQSA